jgi:hypothetical protein
MHQHGKDQVQLPGKKGGNNVIPSKFSGFLNKI